MKGNWQALKRPISKFWTATVNGLEAIWNNICLECHCFRNTFVNILPTTHNGIRLQSTTEYWSQSWRMTIALYNWNISISRKSPFFMRHWKQYKPSYSGSSWKVMPTIGFEDVSFVPPSMNHKDDQRSRCSIATLEYLSKGSQFTLLVHFEKPT